jgi:hypothetical protein
MVCRKARGHTTRLAAATICVPCGGPTGVRQRHTAIDGMGRSDNARGSSWRVGIPRESAARAAPLVRVARLVVAGWSDLRSSAAGPEGRASRRAGGRGRVGARPDGFLPLMCVCSASIRYRALTCPSMPCHAHTVSLFVSLRTRIE